MGENFNIWGVSLAMEPGQTSLEVQNRDISSQTKRTNILRKLKKIPTYL